MSVVNRDILLVLVLSSLAQLAGFGKAVLITYYFGIGTLLDGYYLAQALPAMLAGVFVGFFQTGFVPIYSAHLARGEQEDAQALLGSALALMAVVGAAVSGALSLLAPAFVVALAGGSQAAITDPAVTALRALAFLLLLNALVDCLGLALNSHRRFAAAAAAPIVNAFVSSAILAAAPQWGLTNLIAGTLIGVLFQLVVVLTAAHRAGIRLRRGRLSQATRILRGGGTMLPGLLMSNVAVFVPPAFAARIGDGAVTALSIAGRIHGALTQVFAMALSTVLLAHFAQAVARNETAEIVASLRNSFPAVRLLGIIIVLWVGLAGGGVVGLAFERGAFDSAATAAVATAWLCMAVGIVPIVWGIALAKVLQAMQLGGVLSRVSALSLLVLTSACALGVRLNSLPIIAYASVLAYAATAVALAGAVNGRLAPDGRKGERLPSGFATFLALSLLGPSLAQAAPAFASTSTTVFITLAALMAVLGAAWRHVWRNRASGR